MERKPGACTTDVTHMTSWGNHSATQYPDLYNPRINGESAIELVDQTWFEDTFIPTVQQRGAAIIKARGASSAASAANAAIDHMRTWALGTAENDWTSMGVLSAIRFRNVDRFHLMPARNAHQIFACAIS